MPVDVNQRVKHIRRSAESITSRVRCVPPSFRVAYEPVLHAVEHDFFPTGAARRSQLTVVHKICKKPSNEDDYVRALSISLEPLTYILKECSTLEWHANVCSIILSSIFALVVLQDIGQQHRD
jgi:hypothetical protein